MKYKESDLQQKCVRWFRREYPEYQSLFFHVRNENSEGAIAGGRAVAEGVQAGVADLMLLISNGKYNGLAIEMKDKRGTQRTMQKWFQKYYETQGGKYVICKTVEAFCNEVEEYLSTIDAEFRKMAKQMRAQLELEIDKEKAEEENRRNKRAMQKILNPEEERRKAEEKAQKRREAELEKARKRLARVISRCETT